MLGPQADCGGGARSARGKLQEARRGDVASDLPARLACTLCDNARLDLLLGGSRVADGCRAAIRVGIAANRVAICDGGHCASDRLAASAGVARRCFRAGPVAKTGCIETVRRVALVGDRRGLGISSSGIGQLGVAFGYLDRSRLVDG